MAQSFRNHLLNFMSADDRALITPHFEPFKLVARQVLIRQNAPVDHVYFVESGQLSCLAKVALSESIESGMIGREGMSDMALSGRAPLEVVVQLSGDALRIARPQLAHALLRSAGLANVMLRFQAAMMVQVSYTALSHGAFTVPERLARWLLMVQDHAEADEFPLVHEFFSWMLAVRRAGVTEAFHELRNHGCIATGRGSVKILDRDMLIELASGSYGPPEAEYARLFAPA